MRADVSSTKHLTEARLRDQVAAVDLLTFFGMLANNWGGVPAIVSDNRSGFVGNRDQWLFFSAAMLFF